MFIISLKTIRSISRNHSSKSALLLTGLICLLTAASCQKEAESPRERPNILFILADDLGAKDLSCLGSTYYETPNIDRISAGGMTFTQGYATCQVCSPSRASIMTGRFPARHGITEWIGARSGADWRKLNRHTKMLPAEYKHQLDHELVTLPEVLKDNGYTTFFAGKWHLGGEGSYPEDHGFDINIGGYERGGPRGGYFVPYGNPKLDDGPAGENLSMRLAEETAHFIEEHKDSAFFAYLSFYAVHGPIQTTREKWAEYREKAVAAGISESGYIMERRLPIRQVQDNPVYAGLVEAMDEAVGKVLNKLESLGLQDKTIIIFTSDNGGVASGDNYSTSNLPLRGGKGYQWEGGILEPYFIRVPWMQNHGAECPAPVTGTDFFPTILDLLNIDLMPGAHVDGVSLVPLLRGETIAQRPLYWHYPHYSNQGGDPSSIIRLGEWKLIHYWETRENELYNLADDPYETENLSERYPEKTSALAGRLLSWLEKVDARYPVPDDQYDPRAEAQRMERIRQELLPRLEKQRLDYLSPLWQPNKDWWGSLTVND